ncbi:hypothetical protein Tco_1127340, partial [Tanacetum coccineum]
SICDMVGQIMQKKEEERRIAEDQAAKDRYWKIPICYDDDDDYTIAITPVLLTKELVNSLIMEDEHLDTIPATESDEVIKSSVENLVPIPNILITSPKIDFLSEEFAGELAPILPDIHEADFDEEEDICDDDTSSDDDDFENIEYVDATPPNSELVSLEEVEDGELTSVVISDNSNDLLLEFPEFESFLFDPSFPRPPPEPPDVEISLVIETDASEINDFDELNGDECFDSGGGENNVEVDDSFTFVTWTFLPFLTYPGVSPLLSSTKNEDTIFDPGIFTFHFSLKPVPFALPKDK